MAGDAEDDGIGTDPARARGGLANLQDRARDLGGTLEIRRPPAGGTRLEWPGPAAWVMRDFRP